MKKILTLFVLLLFFGRGFSQTETVAIPNAEMLKKFGVFEKGVTPSDLVDPEYSTGYRVAGSNVYRILFNVIEKDQWVKYHFIVNDGIVFLFFNQNKDFNSSTLLEAFSRERYNSGSMIMFSPEKEDEVEIYHFNENQKYLITRDDDGKIVVFQVGKFKR